MGTRWHASSDCFYLTADSAACGQEKVATLPIQIPFPDDVANVASVVAAVVAGDDVNADAIASANALDWDYA